MAQFEEATIQIPGTQTKVPRRAFLLGLGAIVVLVLVWLTRRNGASQPQAEPAYDDLEMDDRRVTLIPATPGQTPGDMPGLPQPLPGTTPVVKSPKPISLLVKDTKAWLEAQIAHRTARNAEFRTKLSELRSNLPTLSGYDALKAKQRIEMYEKQIPRNEMFINTFRQRLTRGEYKPDTGSAPV